MNNTVFGVWHKSKMNYHKLSVSELLQIPPNHKSSRLKAETWRKERVFEIVCGFFLYRFSCLSFLRGVSCLLFWYWNFGANVIQWLHFSTSWPSFAGQRRRPCLSQSSSWREWLDHSVPERDDPIFPQRQPPHGGPMAGQAGTGRDMDLTTWKHKKIL